MATTKLDSNGAYSIPDATLFIYATLARPSKIKLNTKHLYYWTKEGLAGGYLTGVKNKHLFINFRDLISLRVIAAFRSQGIKRKDIAIADSVLRKRFGWDYPFATVEFWSAKPDIFIKIGGLPLAVSKHLQMAMEFFEQYMRPAHGLSFDLSGIAGKWQPRPDILLDPKIQFGEPCISGTRIPTEVIWSFYRAGDSIDFIAAMYGISKRRVENAIKWEKQIQKAR